MPKLWGVNVLAVLLAAIAFYFVGFVFYGLVFQQLWTAEVGLTEAELAGANQGVSMGLGFVNALVTTFVLALVLQRMPGSGLMAKLGVAVLLWLGFAATTLAYAPIYTLSSPVVFHIDLAHLLVAYCVATVVLVAMKAA
jgi:hypothetical protein